MQEPLQAPISMATAAASPESGIAADLSGGRAVPVAYEVRPGYELAPGGNVRNKATGALVPFRQALALGLVWPITEEQSDGKLGDQSGQVRAVPESKPHGDSFMYIPPVSFSSAFSVVCGCEAKGPESRH